MATPLFRQEALTAQSTQWAGTIVLARPVPMRLAAGIAALLTISLALYLAYGEYTRKIRVAGQLVPSEGAIKVVAAQFGRIVGSRVHEGDVVTSGQILYELTAERPHANGGIDTRIDVSLASRRELLAQERFLQTQQLLQREKSLQARQQLIAAELARLEQEIVIQTERISSADKMRQRYTTLRQQGFVSEMQLSQIENDHNEQLARHQTLERTKLTSQRELLQAREDAQEINGQIRLNEAQTARSLASLDQEVAEH